MKICAIDSSGLVASVAIVEDDITVAEYSIQYKITHSQTLLPMLAEILERIGMNIADVDAWAISAGPGSFTGLRIGVATVKGLGIAVPKPVVSVPTLEALAYNAYGSGAVICPIMDARRHQVYTGLYEFVYDDAKQAYRMQIIQGQQACDFAEICEQINSIGREVIFIGDGIPVYSGEMDELISVPYSCAPAHMNRQRAGALAALAELYLQGQADDLEGQVTTADELAPEYLRLSQAEREKKERAGEA